MLTAVNSVKEDIHDGIIVDNLTSGHLKASKSNVEKIKPISKALYEELKIPG